MVSTITIFSTGYLLSAVSNAGIIRHAVLAAIPLLLSGIAIAVTWVVRAHFHDLAAVIRRLDQALGLFDIGRYLPGESIYPAVWQDFGTKRWREIIFDIFIPLQALRVCPERSGGFAEFSQHEAD
jgi:hypothetical protein